MKRQRSPVHFAHPPEDFAAKSVVPCCGGICGVRSGTFGTVEALSCGGLCSICSGTFGTGEALVCGQHRVTQLGECWLCTLLCNPLSAHRPNNAVGFDLCHTFSTTFSPCSPRCTLMQMKTKGPTFTQHNAHVLILFPRFCDWHWDWTGLGLGLALAPIQQCQQFETESNIIVFCWFCARADFGTDGWFCAGTESGTGDWCWGERLKCTSLRVDVG